MHFKRLSSCPCSPEGLFQKNVTPSWLGLFSACVLLAFLHVEHHNANTRRRSCKDWEPALSLALCCHTHSASVPRWLYGCSLLDGSPLLNIPSLFLLPPFLPSFLSLPAIFCPTWLHARPASLWLLTSKRHFIHQSVIRKRGPFSSALKEREGTRSEFIKKRGDKWMKRGHERERGSVLDRRELGATKARRRMQLWIDISRAALSCFLSF